jgi:hypothetical protein
MRQLFILPAPAFLSASIALTAAERQELAFDRRIINENTSRTYLKIPSSIEKA